MTVTISNFETPQALTNAMYSLLWPFITNIGTRTAGRSKTLIKYFTINLQMTSQLGVLCSTISDCLSQFLVEPKSCKNNIKKSGCYKNFD